MIVASYEDEPVALMIPVHDLEQSMAETFPHVSTVLLPVTATDPSEGEPNQLGIRSQDATLSHKLKEPEDINSGSVSGVDSPKFSSLMKLGSKIDPVQVCRDHNSWDSLQNSAPLPDLIQEPLRPSKAAVSKASPHKLKSDANTNWPLEYVTRPRW